MYCPKCEFEFKQDVAECPICGGALIMHPEEGADETLENAAPGEEDAAEDQAIETSISDLLLNAKHEFDSLESETTADMQQADEETFLRDDDLNFETAETPAPDPAGTAQSDYDPDRDKLATSLDSLVIPTQGDTGSLPWQVEQDKSPTSQADDLPFIPQTPTEPADTAPVLDDTDIKDLENSLDSVVIPSQEDAASLPWQVEQDSSSNKNDTMPFIPEGFDDQPVDVETPDTGSIDTDTVDFADEDEELDYGSPPRSKKRFIIILLCELLVIVAVYLLVNYYLHKPEPDQTKKPVPARITRPKAVKKAPSAIPAPETQPQKPSPTAVEKPAPAEQKEPAAPEKSSAPAVEQKSEEEKTVSPEKKADPSTEQVKSQPAVSKTPDRQQASVKRPYSIHVYSFKAKQDAEKEIKRLRDRGYDAYLATVELENKGTWHRVKIGHYATRDDAQQAAEAFRQKHPRVTPQILRNR